MSEWWQHATALALVATSVGYLLRRTGWWTRNGCGGSCHGCHDSEPKLTQIELKIPPKR
jgi:hypothetical protein